MRETEHHDPKDGTLVEDQNKKMSALEEASQTREVEIKMLKQQGEETNSHLRRLLSLNKE